MSRSSLTCDDQLLLAMLHEELVQEKVDDLLDHVESCVHCQQRVGDLAASSEEWKRTTDLISDSFDAADGPSSFDVPIVGQQPIAWTESMARQLLSPASHPEMLGRLGRYEVERLIGSGGMGVVFKAFDSELNRPVAIKLLAPYLAGSGPARKRFSREARAAAAVVHQHVVPIHNVETDRESPFIVMQFVSGESLQDRIDRDGPLDVYEILRIGMQVADGLSAAHQQGLVHRDIKPSNILLEEDVDRALISDFGLARAADDASLTRTGFHPGTPQYMSPEQASGQTVDARSDLFSLGSMLYTMCTGRLPFRAESSLGVMRRITESEPTPIREINPDIPDWLCSVIGKLMAKDKAARFQSASRVHELLESCLNHLQQPELAQLPVVPGFNDKLRPRPFLKTRSGILVMISLVPLLALTGVLACSTDPVQGWLRGTNDPDHIVALVPDDTDRRSTAGESSPDSVADVVANSEQTRPQQATSNAPPPVSGTAVVEASESDSSSLKLVLTLPTDVWQTLQPVLPDGDWPPLAVQQREGTPRTNGAREFPLDGSLDQMFWATDLQGQPVAGERLRVLLKSPAQVLVAVSPDIPPVCQRQLPSPASLIVMLGPCPHDHLPHGTSPTGSGHGKPATASESPRASKSTSKEAGTIGAALSQAYYYSMLQKAQSFRLESDAKASEFLSGSWRLDQKAHFGGDGHYVRADRGDDGRVIITRDWLLKSFFNHKKSDQPREDLVRIRSVSRKDNTIVVNNRFRLMPIDDDHMAVTDYDFIAMMERVDCGNDSAEFPVDQGEQHGKADPNQAGEPTAEPTPGEFLYAVTVNGKQGFIDQQGQIVIQPRFARAYRFSDGLAAVQIEADGLWGFIDTKGKLVIEPKFVSAAPFSGGMAQVKLGSFTSRWGYIDKSGTVVIQPQYDCADDFHNGIARVGMATAKSQLLSFIADVGVECEYHHIDTQGRRVPTPKPEHYATGKPGELIPFTKNDLVGYVDATGAVIIEPQFAQGFAFSEGLACARRGDLFGYIDRTGQFVIPPRFQHPNDFADGLAGVPLDGKQWGFIDRNGKTVVPAKYDWIYGGFRGGLAEVTVAGRIGYVNKQGDWVW